MHEKNINYPEKQKRSDTPFYGFGGYAVFASSELFNAAGLVKEIDDSRGGSGFSFVDLLVDRAGVRLAEKSVSDVQSATTVQQVLSKAMTESVFMPDIQGLTEGLMEKLSNSIMGIWTARPMAG